MYMAQLRGKLSEKTEKREDILTSDVFSFFKYTDRQVFLKSFLGRFLGELGVRVSDKDVELAEFQFWPRYANRTEPDLVIIVGNYYILIEAKFGSSFEWCEETERSQLHREIVGGYSEARSLGKEFCLAAVTADYTYKHENFQQIRTEELASVKFKWINWQQIYDYLLERMETTTLPLTTRLFLEDLCDLLDKKNLRPYRDLKGILSGKPVIKEWEKIFFASETAKSRGGFIGFQPALSYLEQLDTAPRGIFFQREAIFARLRAGKALTKSVGKIFFNAG